MQCRKSLLGKNNKKHRLKKKTLYTPTGSENTIWNRLKTKQLIYFYPSYMHVSQNISSEKEIPCILHQNVCSLTFIAYR